MQSEYSHEPDPGRSFGGGPDPPPQLSSVPVARREAVCK